jgi:hypothetical protein
VADGYLVGQLRCITDARESQKEEKKILEVREKTAVINPIR